MKRVSRTALRTCLALCLFYFPALAQRRGTSTKGRAGSSTNTSYRKAYEIIERSIKAFGGADALRAAEDVSVKASGVTWARNQSLKVNSPFDQMPRDETLFVNLRQGRYIFENRDPLPGGFVFGNRVVVTGGQGFAANPRDRIVQPLNAANLPAITLNYIRRLPHLLISHALEQRTASLRYLGEDSFQGRKHNVVAFASANGVQISLFFDARTNLLSKYEQMVTDGLDGDVAQETIFPGYRAVSGIQVPTGRITTRGGDRIEDVKYTDVQFNTKPTETAFARPDGYEDLPAPQPPPIRETKLAEGIYLFESGANALVIEFNDHVMIVEPYVGGRGPKPTINKVREMFPSKPLRYVVVTHHHDDHSGGVRSYIANDVAVVTTPANQRYFEQMATSPFTINPDDQTRNPKPVKFEFVRDKKRVFTDGKQTVEIIDIGPSPHAEEMLIAYLPNEKFVFQGDLVNLPNSGKYLPTTVNDSTIHFFDYVQRTKLDVKRVTSVHGPSTSWDDLREAVEKKRSVR